jgi:hypothetical protein
MVGHPTRAAVTMIRPSAAMTWLRTHDPGYAAARRAARAALIMPTMFVLGGKVIGNPTLATFAAFGSFAMLLLVDFQGQVKDRVLDQAALGIVCAALICLATVVSRTTWLAAVAMALVAFAVLFAGVVSSVIAGATTALLLSFILPVSLAGPVSSIPDRVAGWAMAAVVSLPAIALLWPAPVGNPVRTAAIAACRALAGRLRAVVAYATSAGGPEAATDHRDAIDAADGAVQRMHSAFFATPYRPSGLTTDARAVIRLVDELRWLNSIVMRSGPELRRCAAPRSVWAVKIAAANVLERAAELLERPAAPRQGLREASALMRGARTELERDTVAVVPTVAGMDDGGASAETVVSSLDPSFRAQELAFVAALIATNAEFAAAAARRSWIERLLGRQPPGLQGPLTAAGERATAHATRQSIWLHNSLRGAAALGLAVLVADLSSVQHGFWVVLGALSVLRSNALSTGQSIVRGLIGTCAGFVVGGILVSLIGTSTAVLWVLLPIAILFAGLAPAAISFAAGQAGFTLTLVILFNLIVPTGWTIGLVRVEDVALGCVVSLAVGLLFWPRGAGAALGQALARAYSDSAEYLTAAVAYGVGRCDPAGPQSPPPRRQAAEAAAANRRLDDTFRGYLGERGAKPAPLAEITTLLTGVTGVRLAGDAVLDLWNRGSPGDGDRGAARRELMSAANGVSTWYQHFAAGLIRRGPVPEPVAADHVADARLIDTVARDLSDADGHATATALRVIWTGDHLDAARQLQQFLVEPARAAVSSDGSGRLGRMLRPEHTRVGSDGRRSSSASRGHDQ